MTTRIMVVDDHPMVAESLAAALRAPDVEALALDPSAIDPVERLRSEPADLCVVDLYWHGGPHHGLAAIAGIVAAGTECLVFTGTRHEPLLGYCIELGALGVVTKHQSFDAIVDAVREAAAGRSPNADSDKLRWMLAAQRARREHRDRLQPFENLTSAERDVLADLVRGQSVAEISQARFVSVSTVRTQVRQILGKLGVRSQVAAVALVADAGWSRSFDTSEMRDVLAMLPRSS